jgi:hypothetical protein
LTAEQRRRLADGHEELRAAVAAYAEFVGGALATSGGPAARSAKAMELSQRCVETAEEQLWQLRERLLGWARPSWAPRASLVADWFSDEDALYDEIPDTALS